MYDVCNRDLQLVSVIPDVVDAWDNFFFLTFVINMLLCVDIGRVEQIILGSVNLSPILLSKEIWPGPKQREQIVMRIGPLIDFY